MYDRRALAAAQTMPVRGDVEANLQQHVRLVEEAAKRNVGLLAFPELSLTGYELDLAPSLAFETADTRLRPLLRAAAEHHMTIVAGAPVRLGTNLHIGAFLVDATGQVDLYTKQHLGAFRPEDHPDGL